MRVVLQVNGVRHALELPPLSRLIDVLRGPLGLTGTKEGCGEGECGSCAVLLDGEPVNACLVPVGQCDGREVVTVEGLCEGGELSALQQAVIAHGGVQCGACTPGILIVAAALLRRVSEPDEGVIRAAIAGNLCRCTGYDSIVASIREAARRQIRAAPDEEAAE